MLRKGVVLRLMLLRLGFGDEGVVGFYRKRGFEDYFLLSEKRI